MSAFGQFISIVILLCLFLRGDGGRGLDEARGEQRELE